MAHKWYRGATVVEAGPAEDGNIYIRLRTAEFGDRTFSAADPFKKEMLTTALAAMSNRFQVDVSVEDPPNPVEALTPIYRLYVKSPG